MLIIAKANRIFQLYSASGILLKQAEIFSNKNEVDISGLYLSGGV